MLSHCSCVMPIGRRWRHYTCWHEGSVDMRYVQVGLLRWATSTLLMDALSRHQNRPCRMTVSLGLFQASMTSQPISL
jgi:hypothetical protein